MLLIATPVSNMPACLRLASTFDGYCQKMFQRVCCQNVACLPGSGLPFVSNNNEYVFNTAFFKEPCCAL